MKDIGIAIIGHGFMGHEHEKMLLDFPGIKLIGFADIDPKQLEDVTEGLKRYGSNETTIHCNFKRFREKRRKFRSFSH